MSEGWVAMHASLVPRIACIRLRPVMAGTAAARLTFIAGRCRIVEVITARSLQKIATGRRHVAQLRRCAGQDRARQHGIPLRDQRMIGGVGIRHQSANPQSPARRLLDVFSGSREMSISRDGRSTSSFIRSIRLVPPAINFAVGSAEIRRTASATSVARTYWKLIMTAPSPVGSPAQCSDTRRSGRYCRS